MKRKMLFSNRMYYEIISSCNLSCKHCSDLLSGQVEMLEVDEILNFHNKISELGILDSVVTGGEPTLHPKFKEIVFGLSEYGNVVITTNATAISYEMVKEILNYNKNIHIQISLDGLSRETFEKIRGKGQYDKVIAIINQIIHDGLQKQLAFSMTIMKDNYSEVGGLIDFASKNGIRVVHFPQLLPIGNAKKNWEDIAPDCAEQICIENDFLKRMSEDKEPLEISCNRLNQIAARWENPEKASCLSNMVLKVVPNGDILPCPSASNCEYRVENIRHIKDAEELYEACLRKNTELVSLITQNSLCDKNCTCFEECRGEFCSNCMLLGSPQENTFTYEKKIKKRHFEEIRKEIKEEI